MMLLNAVVAMLTLVNPAQAQEPTSKQLIEKMLARYNSAKTLSGTIRLTVAAEGNSVSMDTVVQYEKPAKIYIKQQKNLANPDPSQPSSWLLVSDGKIFGYDAPLQGNSIEHTAQGTRLYENVHNERLNIDNDIRTMYVAAGKSLGDRSMPLDIAIGRHDDLVYRSNQWIDHSVVDKREVKGKQAYVVQGQYRDYKGAPSSGIYQMVITADGDLLQYVEKTKIAVENKPVTLTSQWDVDLKVNEPVDQSLFHVVVK